MADLKAVKNEALATINAALTILDKYPQLDETNTMASISLSSNPFSFLIDLLKSVRGYDYIIELISGFIGGYLPMLEATVKGILISNLKDMLTCSLNPFITKELLLNGIVLELRRLDLMGMFSFSPLDKQTGKFYYFGCEDVYAWNELSNKVWNERVAARKLNDPQTYQDINVSPYESNKEDFNAFLYYVKNFAPAREVWGMKYKEGDTDKSTRLEAKIGPKLQPSDKQWCKDHKNKKRDGIITLEYHERSSSLTNAHGDTLGQQTPFNQCLHVFIGNTEFYEPDYDRLQKELADAESSINEKIEERDNVQSRLNQIWEAESFATSNYESQVIKKDEYKQLKKDYKKERDKLNEQLNNIQNELNALTVTKRNTEGLLHTAATSQNYRDIRQNYYYKRTLVEWNVDYVMSLHLFDPFVITSQIIDAITGCFTVDLNLSYEQMLIRFEVEKMVKMIIESDDQAVSDCFFTFSNDDYDKMLNQAELVRAGMLTLDGRGIGDVRLNAEDLLSGLNSVSSSASKQEIQSVIAGTMTDLTSKISRTEGYLETDNINANLRLNINANLRLNIIENMLNALAYAITIQILSPKIYLVMAINLKILGQDAGFSLAGFIERNKQMVVQILRAVRDAIIDYIVKELMKIVGDLAEQVASKLTIEQVMYYRRLIKKLIDCFRSGRNGLDWNQDLIEHADLIQQEEEPKNAEC